MIFLKKLKMRSMTKKLKAMKQYRVHNQPKDETLAKEVQLYRNLADMYRAKKDGIFKYIMSDECLRAAAGLESSDANYQLAISLLDQAKFRETLEKEGLFANPSNLRQATQLFEEAHAYLLSAENLGHILAKRLRGLCFINGWGVAMDKDKGFELVMASIDQENSWDKVPEIFASIGLNKPEFFAQLGKHRGKQ